MRVYKQHLSGIKNDYVYDSMSIKSNAAEKHMLCVVYLISNNAEVLRVLCQTSSSYLIKEMFIHTHFAMKLPLT